jgi:hypothetical protein
LYVHSLLFQEECKNALAAVNERISAAVECMDAAAALKKKITAYISSL